MSTKSKSKAAPKATKATAVSAESYEQAVETTKAQVEQAVESTKAQVEQAVETTKAQVEQAVETTKAQVDQANEAVAKGYDELAALQKDSVDALIKAGAIWAKGAEDLGKAYFAIAQEAAEVNSEAAKAILSANSLKDVVDLQGELARKSFDKSLSEGAKLSELSLKVANEAFQPIQQQFTAAFEKAGTIAA